MDNVNQAHLRCRLFFYAVLPCLENLMIISPAARKAMAGADFSLCFKTLSGLRTCLQFKEGFCQFYGPRKTATDVELLFFSENQACRMFQNLTALPPLPTRGLFQIKTLMKFKTASQLLENYLQPRADDLDNETFRLHAIELMLTAALGSVCQLGVHEVYSKKLIQNGPQGTVVFKFEKDIRPFWFRCRLGDLQWGRGEALEPADVEVCFKESVVALGALQDTIVSQAEVGLGRIVIEGMYPLADHVSLLLERIPIYLKARIE